MDSQSPRSSARPPQRGGGILIALGLVLGAGIGTALGQPSQGLIIGFAVGGALAIALLFADRR
ncbi:hypothetical protein CHU93_14340 [Sandarakinorhabdus cyanobacteriorum]|uniref:Uncharacterized protein n=1 Tax=Sandarakinorhabdus cyanobacteriorum TaxID=1981098 RepID=A0A255Y7B7_9SPHN|nr:hypothetical protein [Sandarakinorhabdus cyanobacteriorum]OYQ25013.1 hypothetical protein CHU93_14340 [Sandarakinorhabdus cyanobacteriorum]